MNEELTKKVRPVASDVMRRMQQTADELIAGLSGQFHAYTGDAMAEIDSLMAAPCYEDSAWRQRLDTLAHNLKGLGGSFGYDLMTIVADSMCRTISDQRCGTDERVQRRLAALATALHAIVQFDLKGDGGVQGRDLLATLQLSAR